MLNEFCNATDAKPANHLRRNFIPNEIGEKRGMITMRFDRSGYGTSDFFALGFISQKFDMLCPRQCDEHAQTGVAASIEKPERRGMVNAHHIEPEIANIREISGSSFGWTEVIATRIRFERSISDAFDKKFSVVFEEEFCDGADWLRGRGAHSGCSLDQPPH